MSVTLLQKISRSPLPVTLVGLDVPAVESLVDGGLVRATVIPDPAGQGSCQATVHEITALGRKYLRAFPAGPE